MRLTRFLSTAAKTFAVRSTSFARVLSWVLGQAQAKRKALLVLGLGIGLVSPVLQGLSVAILAWLPSLFSMAPGWSLPVSLSWISGLIGQGERAALSAIVALFLVLFGASLAQYLSKRLLLRLSRYVVEELNGALLEAHRVLPNPAWPTASRLLVFERPVVFRGIYFVGVFLNQVLATFPALVTAVIAAAILFHADATFAGLCVFAGLLLPLIMAPFVAGAPRRLEAFKAANQELQRAMTGRTKPGQGAVASRDDAALVADYGRAFQGRFELSQQLVAVLGIGTATTLSLGVCYFLLQISRGQATIVDAIISIGALKLTLNSVSRVAATVGSVSRHHRSIERVWRFFTDWNSQARPANGQLIDMQSRIRIGNAWQFEFETRRPLAIIGTRSTSEVCLALMTACEAESGATIAVSVRPSSQRADPNLICEGGPETGPLVVACATGKGMPDPGIGPLAPGTAGLGTAGLATRQPGRAAIKGACAVVHRRAQSIGWYDEGAIAWVSDGKITNFAVRGSLGWDALVARAQEDQLDHGTGDEVDAELEDALADG